MPSPLDLCRKITKASRSNLSVVGSILPKTKRDFFYAAYASMRVIDDLVDEDYLEQGTITKTEALAAVNHWRDRAILASQSQFSDDKDDPSTQVFLALNDLLGRSDLTAQPWIDLASALTDDIERRELQTWKDFLHYCHGATVAPTHIFLYILSCEQNQEERFHLQAGLDLGTIATVLGTFCYIIHICRDLLEDCQKDAQLITVPIELFERIDTPKGEFAEQIRNNDLEKGVELVTLLTAYADELVPTFSELSDSLVPRLAQQERLIFNGITTIYFKLFEQIRDDPTTPFFPEKRWGLKERISVLRAMGLKV